MKLGVTLDILNQKDTPAFYADTLANRPAAGFTGRVFISTDTLDLYRDTGTTWVLLSPSSTGTITGSGAAGQVTYFSAASSITGNNNLFWDSANNHLGIQTATPDCALDVNHNGIFVAKFNNTTTANTLIGIYNLDNPQWLIGSNSVANDLTFYDATNFPTLVATTTMKTDGTTYIGGQTTGSGRLNVYSATGDNGIQISGANAPSLRIDNAPTGATKRIGLGISTAVNNFIQGSADRDMCIFNGSTTASPMLFGIYDTTNVQEAARISAARNFLISSVTDSGEKLQVNGVSLLNGNVKINSSAINNYDLNIYNTTPRIQLQNAASGTTTGDGLHIYQSGTDSYILNKENAYFFIGTNNSIDLSIDPNGNFGVGISVPTRILHLSSSGSNSAIRLDNTTSGRPFLLTYDDSENLTFINSSDTGYIAFRNATGAGQEILRIPNSRNVLIGTTTDNGNKLNVNGNAYVNGVAELTGANFKTANQYLRSINISTPGSTTTTILRFLDNAGNLSGQNAIFGIINIFVGWNAGYNLGSNIYTYSISCSSNGTGVLSLLSSNVVGSSLVTSVTASADGTGCKIDLTTNAVGNALGTNTWITFTGNFF